MTEQLNGYYPVGDNPKDLQPEKPIEEVEKEYADYLKEKITPKEIEETRKLYERDIKDLPPLE